MRALLAVITVLLAAGATSGARAADLVSGWAGIPEAEVRLIAGHVPGHGDMLGLQFALAPGWKTYWRSPGEAGLPPQPDWGRSEGVADAELAWPLPEKFLSYGLVTYGYHDQVVLPVRLVRTGDKTRVRLDLLYAACAEVCIPVETELALDLPEGPLPANRHGEQIGRALARAPAQSPPDLGLENLKLDHDSLAFDFRPPRPLSDPKLIVEGPRDVLFDEPQCHTEGALTRCRMTVDRG